MKRHNTFTVNLLQDLAKDIGACDVLYFDYLIENAQTDLLNNLSKCNMQTILLRVVDDISFKGTEKFLLELCSNNPYNKFFIFLSNFNYVGMDHLQNVKIIYWPEFLYEIDSYAKLNPQEEKNFNTSKPWVSLNRNVHPHRLTLVSYLYGLQLQSKINISLLKMYYQLPVSKKFLDIVNWDFSENSYEIQDIVFKGFENVLEEESFLTKNTDSYELAPGTETILSFSNAKNFDNNLRHIYNNSFVEIIAETTYLPGLGMVTEKYLNSVYGYNFPILISSPGTVSHLRSIGFDMFDDIIDHSYDLIQDPLLRIESAIKQNLQLLNLSEVSKVWKENKHRFNKNIWFAKNRLCDKIIESMKNEI